MTEPGTGRPREGSPEHAIAVFEGTAIPSQVTRRPVVRLAPRD